MGRLGTVALDGMKIAASASKAVRQLSMRGKAKAAAEWTFTCTVRNLFKALTTGHLTPQALGRVS